MVIESLEVGKPKMVKNIEKDKLRFCHSSSIVIKVLLILIFNKCVMGNSKSKKEELAFILDEEEDCKGLKILIFRIQFSFIAGVYRYCMFSLT